MSRTSHWLLMLATTFTLGCGPSGDSAHPTNPVTGTVTQNGSPVADAVVTFQPLEGGKSAVGSTDAKGVYSLSTFNSNDGALAGQYKITITKFEGPPPTASTSSTPPGTLGPPGLPDDYAPPAVGGGAGKAKDTGPKNLLPTKYANGDTSALRATVEKGKNKFDFDLK